ncbi:Rossmann-like and DUF2520 domain-containing protein [uncultured Muribaculum sp.]|uniref:Rossmann-like and DUF2520 domain-containing protein n=2 Tax=uncultured Muribaculum sp. TaxID=1918613 RepID=UPI0026DF7E81|nr:DUF2520 domain-containing protein [uncultured Muribaculum sp.]
MARTMTCSGTDNLRHKTAVIIGSGNVATQLGKAICDKLNILQVFSPNLDNAYELSKVIGSEAINSISQIKCDADIYILAISDDAIEPFLKQVKCKNGLWVHTSGSTNINVLYGIGESQGVLYPLQTFSKHAELDFANINFLTEATSDYALNIIDSLAKATGSTNISHVSSLHREKLHVAAVFACNFANFMWTQADKILSDIGIEFNALQSLIEATLKKALTNGPEYGQTGPARRGDMKIITHHIESLDPYQAEIYKFISQKISEYYTSNS